ncbi:TorF family putative porin [Roseicella aquatilis]|uniref:Uncharacterized protein n=1 Tax=Roseicella aquatilis TaxID=2527868 RepID=A0A4R4D6M1_9PROT|nr:TorF family putative porin [Roseicella aquatilis]TCZ55271.1 hypothetical protein EXY23_22060 [Roseicella aquatilis]
MTGLLARPAALLRGALLAAAAFVLPALPAAAQQKFESAGLTVTATPSVSNDYLFRGISQTRNNWAVQGTLDVQHDTGFYIGGFVSNAKFLAEPWNDTRQELDALAGYRFTLADINFDIGYIGYFYPGQEKAPGTQLNEYHEVAIKANYTIDIVKLLLAYNYSPNFFGRSGAGNYIEGGADVTLPYGLTASGRLGYQWIQNNPRFGTPDYLWYSVGLSREIYGGVTGTLAWYGTNISKSECAPLPERATGGQRICEGRVLFTLSKTF